MNWSGRRGGCPGVGNAASVKVAMSGWIDYLHEGKVDGRWVIINVLWELKPESAH